VTGAPERALVVGAGIGGLALASALGRRGVAVDVVDNQAEWGIARSGIALQAPAVRAFAALGSSTRSSRPASG
jgi:2-polyprenyl-6-methoxyphenol hydroxylase-like FAD-dependent oxidoreductase